MKLKIGITCYPTVGGSGVIATELGKILAERGHEVHFITSNVPFRLDKVYPNLYYHEVEVNQYSVFRYPPYDLSLASKMAQIAKREKLDILHVHYAVPHAICAYLAKQMVGDHLKIVTTLHGTDITVLGYDPSLSEIIRFGIENSDTVTAVSEDLINETRRLLNIEKDIACVYNFVDEREYFRKDLPQLKEEFAIKDDEKVIVHTSNFRPVKRVIDIIHTFNYIQKEIKAKLLLIGDGPQYPLAYQLVKELGLEEKVLFLGSQKRVADLLSISDLKLLLSEKESFGLVALEAMACGIPVIGTNIGGIPEVIIDGETGYIVELGDTKKAAQLAIQLLQNDELYERMSNQATMRVRDYFHSDYIVSQYERIYEMTLRDHK